MSQVACHDAKPHDIIPTSTAIAASTITKSMLYRVGKSKIRTKRQKTIQHKLALLPLQVESQLQIKLKSKKTLANCRLHESAKIKDK